MMQLGHLLHQCQQVGIRLHSERYGDERRTVANGLSLDTDNLKINRSRAAPAR